MISFTGLQSAVYFLYLFSIVYSSGPLQYKCEPGSVATKVNIVINKKANTLTAFNINTNNTDCTKAGNSSYFRLNGCPVKTSIMVIFTHPEGTDNLIRKRGFLSYILNCTEDDKPVIRTVTANPITVNTPSASSQSPNTFERKDWIPTLSMQISESNVVIGDTVNLVITSSKNKESTISALNCTASSTAPDHTHVLWQSNDCDKGDADLFGDTDWVKAKKQISHQFEAFRFKDNHDVQITCTVRICPIAKKDLCTLACTHKGTPTVAAPVTAAATPTPIPGVTHRRRRRAAQSETTKVLKTTFRVSDYLQHQNTNSGTNSGTCKGSFLATSAISTVVLFYTVLL